MTVEKATNNDLALITGNAHPQLARRIAKILQTPLLGAGVGKFRDSECRVKGIDDTRGLDVYIIQPTCQPDRNKTEIQLIVNGIRRSAKKITVVLPYMGYSRQDRRGESREPISVITMMRDLVNTGIDAMLFYHLHNPVTAGFPEAIDPHMIVDQMNARPVILEWLLEQDLSHATVASTDTGGAGFVRSCCDRLWKTGIKVEFGIGWKAGSSSTEIEEIKLFGKYDGREVFFIDDQSQSGETLTKAGKTAKEEKGAAKVTAIIVHPVIPDRRACEEIANGPVDRLVVMDTLPLKRWHREILAEKLIVLPTDKYLAVTIWHKHCDRSLTDLFELEGYHDGLKKMKRDLESLRA